MNRAERRRQKKHDEKVSKPPLYTYTPESLRGQLKWEANQEFQEKVRKIKEEATSDAINTAMTLLLTLPCTVLMEHFWQKSASKNIPKFLDMVLSYYERWQNGELNMGKLKQDLWEIGGIRLEEEGKRVYKNQSQIEEIRKQVEELGLQLTRITAGDDMVAISVGLDIPEKGNKETIKKLTELGFKKIRREKVTERAVKEEYQDYKYRVILEKSLEG